MTQKQYIYHREFSENTVGRDFVVGDIHGNYTGLCEKLEARDFDVQRDRLFAVGDLIDRGTENLEVLRLLETPWFYSCFGNHEDMFIGRFVDCDAYDAGMHKRHGGKWADDLAADVIEECVSLVLGLPWAMTLVTAKGTVGIVHSEVKHEDWGKQQAIAKPWYQCLWNNSKIRAHSQGFVDDVKGIDVVVSGHMAVTSPLRIGNHWFIDTFYRSNELTVMAVDELF